MEPKKFQLDRGPYLSQLDYQSRLQFQAPAWRLPLTSIICTIGPSSNQPEVLLELIRAGMRVVRLDLSQGSHSCHCQAIQAARKAISMYVEETGLPRSLAIALDTKGPEIHPQGIPVDLPSISEQDKLDLEFGVDQKVDMIFASLTSDARAPREIRQALGPSSEHIKIISKIESREGLANVDEIIRESDGIMVALGNLGSKIPLEAVPLAQKSIVAKCNKVGKPVICANQLMNSMITKPRPTRAESSDVANAIFDGCDAVMLSDETAKGKYPAQCVQCMARICTKVESILWYECLQNNLRREVRIKAANHISAVTTAIAEAATVGQAQAIVVASQCSLVPQMVSHMRPPCPIVMLTGCQHRAAQSSLSRGVFPLLVKEMVYGSLNYCRIMQSGLKMLAKMDILEPGQRGTVVLVNAMSADMLTFRLFTFVQPTEADREEERCRKLARKQRCQEMKVALSKPCSDLKSRKTEISTKPKENEECPTHEEASKCFQLEKQSEQKRSKDFVMAKEGKNICSTEEFPKKDHETLKCLKLKNETQAQAEAKIKRMEEPKKAQDFRKNNKSCSNLKSSMSEISIKPKETKECPMPERASKCLQMKKQSKLKKHEYLAITKDKKYICSTKNKESPEKMKKEKQAQSKAEMKRLEDHKKAEDGRKYKKALKDSLSIKKTEDNASRCNKRKKGSLKKDKCRVVKIPRTSQEKDNYSLKNELIRKNNKTSNPEKNIIFQAESASTHYKELEKSWDIILENCKTLKLENCKTVKLENCKTRNLENCKAIKLENCKAIKLENCKQPSRHRKTTDRSKKV
ncbi:uncharacterized protein LOC122622285 [Drosophila teissieri]|uniref:uncharacterized protein LOC122622285 n=1 Tax=Drosophila teissieri TaxID=7243 RepID=UPI001CB9F7B4|nr:uncharacterized protein LOC122622285 [Drosophila teissieri]XP_043656561.1 uncharacterized protein LOC122622285 [Drosophila teissieri]